MENFQAAIEKELKLTVKNRDLSAILEIVDFSTKETLNTGLATCVYYNYPAGAKALITAGADVNFSLGYGVSILGAAVLQGSVEIARMLIEAGAVPVFSEEEYRCANVAEGNGIICKELMKKISNGEQF